MPVFWGYPRRPMITHTFDSNWILSQNKTKSKLEIKNICKSYFFLILKKSLAVTHLKLLDKMCKYKMDLASIFEDRADMIISLDGRMDRWTETSSVPIDIKEQLKIMKIIYMIYVSIIKYDNSKLRDNSIPSSAIKTEVTGTLSGISQGSISHPYSPIGLWQGSAAGTPLTYWPLRYVAVIKYI